MKFEDLVLELISQSISLKLHFFCLNYNFLTQIFLKLTKSPWS